MKAIDRIHAEKQANLFQHKIYGDLKTVTQNLASQNREEAPQENAKIKIVESNFYMATRTHLKSTSNLTIIIPAYNLPTYTAKCLESLRLQTLRPLNIIVLDDASPNSLESCVNDFRESSYGDQINIAYIRNSVNKGVLNIIDMYSMYPSKFGMQMPHDDWLVDPDFLETAVSIMRGNTDIGFVYASSISEIGGKKMFDLPSSKTLDYILCSDNAIYRTIIEGGFTAWSSIVFDVEYLRRLGWPNPWLFVYPETAKSLELNCDDGFSSLFLLAKAGYKAAFSSRIVSVRGEPPTQYSRSDNWRIQGSSLSFVYYNLLRLPPLLCAVDPSIKIDVANQLSLFFYWAFLPNEKYDLRLVSHYIPDPFFPFLYTLHFVLSKFYLNRHFGRFLVLLFGGKFIESLHAFALILILAIRQIERIISNKPIVMYF